ncbi:MAG: D-2-hydroxyacid dehydrogenase [Chloroflexota bacterium]
MGQAPLGLPETGSGANYAFAEDLEGVRRNIAAAEIVYQYGSPRTALREVWADAGQLRWVHVGGVGVDWALFPELIDSDVIMTNSRGIFDVTLPEYVLTLMLALLKDLPGTIEAQRERRWSHRAQQPLAGGRVLILGAGSIARASGRMLRALGMEVILVGRTVRDGSDSAGEGRIRGVVELHELLPQADWLISLVPLTGSTRGLIGEAELALLPAGARLLNVGRGPVVAEGALLEALRSGALAGAALDVFETEPLPPDSPLWSMPGVIVSPHIGGDVIDTPAAFTRAFLANLARYIGGQELRHVVDKQLGYVPSAIAGS